ncbi:MAG TPA: hypothetical protein VHA33_29250 [Candidatus Angelobacter sp.]|jgi:hypothetical protein|nr:hypothetical protein [Candidatus Angelobacter sp.]
MPFARKTIMRGPRHLTGFVQASFPLPTITRPDGTLGGYVPYNSNPAGDQYIWPEQRVAFWKAQQAAALAKMGKGKAAKPQAALVPSAKLGNYVFLGDTTCSIDPVTGSRVCTSGAVTPTPPVVSCKPCPPCNSGYPGVRYLGPPDTNGGYPGINFVGPPATNAPTVSFAVTPGPANNSFRRSVPIARGGLALRGLGIPLFPGVAANAAIVPATKNGSQPASGAGKDPGANQPGTTWGFSAGALSTIGILVAAGVAVWLIKKASNRPTLGRPIRGVQAFERYRGE